MISFKPEQQMSIFPHLHGVYYVEYPDGGRSGLTTLSIAQSYAATFRGTVRRDPDAPTGIWGWLFERLIRVAP